MLKTILSFILLYAPAPAVGLTLVTVNDKLIEVQDIVVPDNTEPYNLRFIFGSYTDILQGQTPLFWGDELFLEDLTVAIASQLNQTTTTGIAAFNQSGFPELGTTWDSFNALIPVTDFDVNKGLIATESLYFSPINTNWFSGTQGVAFNDSIETWGIFYRPESPLEETIGVLEIQSDWEITEVDFLDINEPPNRLGLGLLFLFGMTLKRKIL